MKQRRGFTVIELVFIVALLGFASVLFFVQKHNIEVANDDATRKTAINAMYYSLEEVYYPKHASYPQTISADILPSVDPKLFTDPNGVKLGQTEQKLNGQTVSVQPDYRYQPTNCSEGACKSYTLRTSLVNEADYVKTSRHN